MEPSIASADAAPTPEPTHGPDRLLRVLETAAVDAGSEIGRPEGRPGRRAALYVVPTPPHDRDEPLPLPTLAFGARRSSNRSEASHRE